MYDKSGQLSIGNDKALNSVNGALARLSLGKEGKALVSDLMSSTTNNTEIAVRNGADNSTEPTKGSYVIWDPNNTTGGPDQNGNTTRESFLGLGHELAHVQDIWAGTVDHNIWVTVQKPDGTYKNIENNDIYATHIENKLRTENGVLLRAAYLPTPAGAVDLNGNPIPSTRIIRAGTSESIFYQQNGTTNYLPLKKGQTPYKYK
jgi:hypothetical protein